MSVVLAATVALAAACTQEDPAAEHAALVARGHETFTRRCAPCHGPEGDWPMAKRLKGRTAAEFYALFDHLNSVNPIMPPFDDAPDEEQRAVAAYLASLTPDSWDERAPGERPAPRGDAQPRRR